MNECGSQRKFEETIIPYSYYQFVSFKRISLIEITSRSIEYFFRWILARSLFLSVIFSYANDIFPKELKRSKSYRSNLIGKTFSPVSSITIAY